MFHFFKYLFLTLAFFALLNIFRSNQEVMQVLHFQIPLIGDYISPPVPVFYLLILAFCGGAFFMSLLGALRVQDVSREKREIKKLKKEMQTLESFYSTSVNQANKDTLPPIIE